MMRRYAKLFRAMRTALLMLVALAGASAAGTLENQPSTVRGLAPAAKAMKFTVQTTGGNCNGCSWVSAEGVIEPGTTEKFKAFVATENPERFIVFHSLGGNVIEALKLGRVLRTLGWDTFAAKDPTNAYSHPGSGSGCYSACVYAFAGGVHRIADDKSIGIHQFYRPDDALRPNDKTLSAVDMSNMQRLAALLNEYVRQMGVDPRLVTLASAITPWEPIHLLSSAELQALNLDNMSAEKRDGSYWSVQPVGDGAMAVTTQLQDGAGRTASLSIWCRQNLSNTFIVQVAVNDDTKDWALIFKSVDLRVTDLFLSSDQEEFLDHNRLLMPVKRAGNGALLGLTITKDELRKMMQAKTVRIEGFTNRASESWTGRLGGTFSMMGGAAVINLALKNCVSQ